MGTGLIFETWRVGVIFNALVNLIVAIVSFSLVIFLFRRWERSDLIMRAYAWFWLMTTVLWALLALRSGVIGFGYFDTYYYSAAYWYDIAIQMAIFLTGPPLAYYVGLRVFHRLHIAQWMAWGSFFIALISMFFVLLPGGISEPNITYFSADSRINLLSLVLFSVEVAMLGGLLMYDCFLRLRLWRADRNKVTLYDAMYSATLLIYLFFGAIDQSKIFIDWPTIVFRVLYSIAFLITYIMITQQDALREEYFVEDEGKAYM
jgi:hypothetical protein